MNCRWRTLVLVALVGVMAAHAEEKAVQADDTDSAAMKIAGFEALIGNNAPLGAHCAGYNGIFSLVAPTQEESPFVPLYAGLNLEHYFDASPRSSDGAIFVEPRRAPLAFRHIAPGSVELHQPKTPHYAVESWTRFELREPHYIDFAFRCVPHRADLRGGFLGVFWASYINAPSDKSIYFLSHGSSLDDPRWIQFCTQAHDRDSTVRSDTDAHELPFETGEATLFRSLSPLRYSVPFFYGRVRDHVLIYIFEPGPCIRFAHSPSGGGHTPSRHDTHPAWDFQFIVPGYEAGKEYGFRARLVYKPWVDRADVIEEVRAGLAAFAEK